MNETENQEKNNKSEILQKVSGFQNFDEVKAQYPNTVDLSNSDKKKMSYQEVENYLRSIVNDVMVTTDNDKIAISDNYEHVMKSSEYSRLTRRGKEEIKTYAAEIEKIIPNSEFENELPNHDIHKPDVEKFKYYSVPVWMNNRAYNVLLECGVLKEKDTSETQAREGVLKNVTEVSNKKYIRKNGKLQVVDISYLYNIRNRPLLKNNQELQKQVEQANITIQEQKQQLVEQDKLLNGKGSIIVNGVERKFEHGLKHAFPEAVKRIDIENQRNKDLTAAYNELAKSKSNNISPKSPSDDGYDR